MKLQTATNDIFLWTPNNLLLRVQSLFWKLVLFLAIFFKAIPVSLNCLFPCQIDLVLGDPFPYVTLKIALKCNNGLEHGKSHDAFCLLLNVRRHTDRNNLKFRSCENLATNSWRICLNIYVHLYNKGDLLR